MEENLIGYLLKALDPEAHWQVELHLRLHPEDQQKLEPLRATLAHLELDKEDPPPPGDLRLRALARVAEYRCQTLPKAPRTAAPKEPTRRRWGWPRADLIVAAVLLLTVGGVALPFVARVWEKQRELTCKNNLRRFYEALVHYSELPDHHDQFPQVELEGEPPRNMAGVVVPLLNEKGLLGSDSVICPSSGNQSFCSLSLQDLDKLRDTDPAEWQRLTQNLTGGYAYTLGYYDAEKGGRSLFGLRRDSGDKLPIMSDAPPIKAIGVGNSPNHGGQGQNVLYIGGNVLFCKQRTAGVDGDDIFVNYQRQIAGGEGKLDTVLGASSAVP
jgi:hypothetical protein